MPQSNLVISLFDPQLDISRNERSNVVFGKMKSPILSLPAIPQMPIASSHLILVPQGAEKEAEKLADRLTNLIAKSIKRKASDSTSRKKLVDGIAVETVPVDYQDIWDFEECTKDIDSILSKKIGSGNMPNTLILNLIGGTAAARTALYLTAIRHLRENQRNLFSKIQKVKKELKNVGNEIKAANEKIEKAQKAGMETEEYENNREECKLRLKQYNKQLDALTFNLFIVRKTVSQTKKIAGAEHDRKPTGVKHDVLTYDQVDFQHPRSVGLLTQGIGTKNPVFGAALDRLEQIILTSRYEKILITGPTGAGKSELAKLVMDYMRALHKDVTKDNCIHQNVAAIAPTLIESELFGHEKGAFTGAVKQRRGIFERADKGVVFLDEIGELPKDLQAKLLTVLDDKRFPFTRIGGTENISSDFLLLCGTNVDLESASEKGTFRRDLFERLRTWTIEVPAINDRLEDLEVALQRERGEWLAKTGIEIRFQKTTRKEEVKGNDKAKGNNKEKNREKDALSLFMEKARAHTWAGNFREFHATFAHLAMTADNGSITNEAIKDEFRQMEKGGSISLPMSNTTPPVEKVGTEYDMADIARLACALDVCRKAKTASEAGEILFAARAKTAIQNGTQFNGASSLQRLFSQFGLKATFKQGTFSLQNI